MNESLKLFGLRISGLLTGLIFTGLLIGIIISFVKNWIMYALILIGIGVVLTLILSALKYYIDIQFWPASVSASFSWFWSLFWFNRIRVDVPIDAIRNPVGSMAPGVLMNGSAPENSTVFLYKAESGKSYLARDTNFGKNGGAFHEIISSNSTIITISYYKQRDILYTDLKNGGFFEYASLNPNHTSAMKIMMNTKTVTETTKYLCDVKNSDSSILAGYSDFITTDWILSFENIFFGPVKENWHTGNTFQLSTDRNDRLNTLKSCLAIVANRIFRLSWTDQNLYWTNTSVYQLAADTPHLIPNTHLLVIHNTFTGQTMKNDAYISLSNDRGKYMKVDISNGNLITPYIYFNYNDHGMPISFSK